LLYDGGTRAAGEALVQHVRTHFGTRRVDHVVNSHPDGDHASGLAVVLEQLDVQRLWMHRPWAHSPVIHGYFDDGRITEASLAARLQDMISGGQGKFPDRLRITAPDRKNVISEAQLDTIVLEAGRSSVIANIAKPFIGPSFGEYTVQFEVGTAKFRFPVTIESGLQAKVKTGRVRKS
jgi:hypothetical protein